MKTAVVILNWNGEALLRKYLPQVVENTDSEVAQIVVADNGSTDGSADYVASAFPEIELLKFDRNYGFAEGYNRAIAQIDCEIVILLNSDVAPCKGWLGPLLQFLETHPEVAAVQPKVLSDSDPARFEYAGACGGFLDVNGYPYCRGRIFDTVETDNGQYDSAIQIFWASGAALCIRRNVYLQAGGLDPLFFAHMEEIDLCWRVQNLGYQIFVVPTSVVCHLGGGSLPYGNPRKTYLNFRNNLLMMYKNLPSKGRARKLFVRRLLDTLAWLKSVASADWATAKSILKAHRDYRRMLVNYRNCPEADVSQLELMHPRVNILIEYYLRRNRSFPGGK